jgi:hypothetical protein
VIDFHGFLKIARFRCSAAAALIFKASRTSRRSYQQSYPQKSWIVTKLFPNQRLEAGSAISLQFAIARRAGV